MKQADQVHKTNPLQYKNKLNLTVFSLCLSPKLFFPFSLLFRSVAATLLNSLTADTDCISTLNNVLLQKEKFY